MPILDENAHDALAMIEYGDEPSVLIMADSQAAFELNRRAAGLAGCRVSDEVPIAGGLERLQRQAGMAAVLIEIEEDRGAELDGLLDRLNAGARAGEHGAVVIAPAKFIDLVAAHAGDVCVHHLCDPEEHERAEALAVAVARRLPQLQDVRRDGGRLQQLSDEVGRIASALANLSEGGEGARPPAKPRQVELTATDIRRIIRARRLRDQYFKPELFADPAWDMLLDLLAARLENQRVAVSSLCIAAAVPPTTALRWIKRLTDHGLFVRSADPQDGRRVYIELSDSAARAVTAYLEAAHRLSPLML